MDRTIQSATLRRGGCHGDLRMRLLSMTLALVWLGASVAAAQPSRASGSQQRPAPNTTKADAWPQFRGDPALTGISSSVLPASLKLLSTAHRGDAIEAVCGMR